MCRRIECAKCGLPTYAGCGLHVEQVLGDVPPEKRCRCREDAAAAKVEGTPGEGGQSRSWLRALLGK